MSVEDSVDKWITNVDALGAYPGARGKTELRIGENFADAQVLGRNDEETKAGKLLRLADTNHRLVESAIQQSLSERS